MAFMRVVAQQTTVALSQPDGYQISPI
jgi:hypothetical protein